MLCSCLLTVSLLYILFPENITLFPHISWFVLYLILQAFTNQNATLSNYVLSHFLLRYTTLFCHSSTVSKPLLPLILITDPTMYYVSFSYSNPKTFYLFFSFVIKLLISRSSTLPNNVLSLFYVIQPRFSTFSSVLSNLRYIAIYTNIAMCEMDI